LTSSGDCCKWFKRDWALVWLMIVLLSMDDEDVGLMHCL